MSLDAIQQKKQVIESRSRIREFVFGIQDGLISTVGLLAGVQSATESNVVVIVTGFTAMFSGAISMATGSYLSSGAQKDIFDKELADAEKLAASEPYIAAEGLLKALGEEGLSKEQSYRMVKVLLAERNVFMRTFQEKVFGLGSAEINQPFKAALVMGLSFIIGAVIPIVPFIALGGVRGALPVGLLERGDTVYRRRVQRPSRRPVDAGLRRQVFCRCRERRRLGLSHRSCRAVVLSRGSRFRLELPSPFASPIGMGEG